MSQPKINQKVFVLDFKQPASGFGQGNWVISEGRITGASYSVEHDDSHYTNEAESDLYSTREAAQAALDKLIKDRLEAYERELRGTV